jgi:hypothetical protein
MINTVIFPHSLIDSYDSSNGDGDDNSSVMTIIVWVMIESVSNHNMDSNTLTSAVVIV